VPGENISQLHNLSNPGTQMPESSHFLWSFHRTQRKRPLCAHPENLYKPIQQGVVLIRASQIHKAPSVPGLYKKPSTAALLERTVLVLPAKVKP